MNRNIEIKSDSTYFIAIGFENCVIVELSKEKVELYNNDEETFADIMYDEYHLNIQCSWDVVNGSNFSQF